METCQICGAELTADGCPACDGAGIGATGNTPSAVGRPHDGGLFSETKGVEFFGVVTPPSTEPGSLPSVTPRKSRAWMYALGGFAVVLAGIGFVNWSLLGLFAGNDNDTAGYVPLDAQAYFVIDLVDSAAAYSDARVATLMSQIESEFGFATPDLTDGAVEEEILDGMAQELGVSELNLSFRDDVASWAGRHVAVWFRADISADAGPDDVAGCFLVETRDVGEADAAMERVYEQIRQGDIAVTRTEIDGVPVYEWSDEVVVKAGRIDAVVALCAGAGTFEEVKAAHESGVTLASGESFGRLEGALGDWAMMGYIDTGEVLRQASLGQTLAVAPYAGAVPIAFGANLTEAGFTVESVSVPGPDFPVVSDGIAAARILPGDVYFAAGGQDLGRTLSTVIDLYRDVPDVGDMFEDVFTEMRQATGVDPQQVLDSMEGPFGLAVSANSSVGEVPIGGVFFTDLSDRGPIDELSVFVNEDSADMSPVERSVGEFDVVAYDFGFLGVGIGVSDRRFVFAIEDELIEQMASGDVLADDPSFQAAVGYLPESSGWVAYVDVRKVAGAVIDFMDDGMARQADEIEIMAALKIVGERFPYGVVGVETIDGLVRQTSVIVFSEGSDPGA